MGFLIWLTTKQSEDHQEALLTFSSLKYAFHIWNAFQMHSTPVITVEEITYVQIKELMQSIFIFIEKGPCLLLFGRNGKYVIEVLLQITSLNYEVGN